MTIELLPCPFCGNRAIIKMYRPESALTPQWQAYCTVCHGNTMSAFWTKDEATQAWNKRDKAKS